jgi:DNA-binding NtrC family response regulator
VIVISGQGTISRAVEAGQAGAFYFLEKPVSQDGLLDMLRKAIERNQERAEHQQLKEQIAAIQLRDIVGQSKKMKTSSSSSRAWRRATRTSSSRENGTGKELIANAIHYNSNRVKGPVHQDQLRGDPEGADRKRALRLQEGAHSPAPTPTRSGSSRWRKAGRCCSTRSARCRPYLQTKLLRVLQEREYRPIGSDASCTWISGLICATNIDLDLAPAEGKLREDLYFPDQHRSRCGCRRCASEAKTSRCFVITFCRSSTSAIRRTCARFRPRPYHLLIRNRWSGNVRELENAIERAVLVSKTGEILPNDLPETDSRGGKPRSGVHRSAAPHAGGNREDGDLQTLQRTNWNKQEAAQILGLYRPRSTAR